MFCNKLTPLCTFQYRDLFITYKESFILQTGKRKALQLPEDEQNDRSPPNLLW